MANSLGTYVWKVDTASATAITTNKVKVRKFVFVPNAADDDVTVKDSNGELLWEIVNALAGGQVGAKEFDYGAGKEKTFEGLAVTTLTASAILYIYLA